MINIMDRSFSNALRAVVMIMAMGAVALLSGCMSANTESDLPWNTPQTWEGSVSLPGMNQGGY
ncbi:MAG: hypothetical protein KAI74_03955 [Kiritimatiellae bacterium]|nr:hypothetical protein [Kiritimatiellia bacterium]